jgi:hypothetical protein
MLESFAAQAHAGVRAWRLPPAPPVCEARAHVAYACKCAGMGKNKGGGGGGCGETLSKNDSRKVQNKNSGRTYKEEQTGQTLYRKETHSAQTARTHMRHDGMQGLGACTGTTSGKS